MSESIEAAMFSDEHPQITDVINALTKAQAKGFKTVKPYILDYHGQNLLRFYFE